MKKYFGLLISGLACFVQTAKSQSIDEAIRVSWFTPNGTARNMAVGGVMGSLGGDITANHVNPAGIGLYKTRELVLSPGFISNNNKFNYRGSDTSSKKSGFGLGTSGLILAGTNRNGYSKWTSSAFAISVNQLANYNNQVSFKGLNNFSSFTEKYLEELTRDRADTNAALSNYIFGSSLAFRTFLVDTLSGPGGSVAGYQSLVPISSGVNQLYNARTSGGYSEIALGLAGNMADKLYVGGSLTIPIIKYSRDLFYSERDATTDPGNQFSFFEYRETYTSQGAGIGLKLGTIYKPSDFVRIGFAFHSPQIISMTDRIRATLLADTEGYAGQRSASSDNLNNGQAGKSNYTITTPWRAIGSFSIVLREINDTRLQKGFISADLEYVHYKGARFAVASENASNPGFRDYYSALNDAVIDNLKGNINARIGGELKFHTIMFRLGAAYYGSPYQDEAIQASRVIGSGGIGYRNKGIFIDLSYSHIMNKDAVFAYRLNDKPNTFATQTGNRGNMMLTFGFKF